MKHFLLAMAQLALMGSVTGVAQVDPSIEQGVHPFGSYDASQVDTISLQNGGLSVSIPLFAYPERGKFGATIALMMTSKQWDVQLTCDDWSGGMRWRMGNPG